MQQSIVQIRDKLLAGLDQDYNVVDLDTVIDVLTQLESYSITKEALEATRLGKHINGLRKNTKNQALANRAKNLVKKWRKLLVNPTASSGASAPGATPATSTATLAPSDAQTNGHGNRSRLQSPALSASGLLTGSNSRSGFTTPSTSPSASNGLPPHSQLHPHQAVNNYLPPHTSLPSSRSGSPAHHANRSDGRGSLPQSPTSRPSSPYNHLETGLPRTNAANKRLRKLVEENGEDDLPPAKRSRSIFANGVGQESLLDGLLESNSNSNGRSDNNGHHTPGTNGRQAKLGRRSAPGSARVSPNLPVAGTPGGVSSVLDQQMQSVRKKGKVKTTQEIVQELALRSQSPGLPQKATSSLPESSREDLVNKFLAAANSAANSGSSTPLTNGQSPIPSASGSRSSSRPMTPNKVTLTPDDGVDPVEAILAQLPPLDVEAAKAYISENANSLSDNEEDDLEVEGLIPVKKEAKVKAPVTEAQVEQLHEAELENVNGNRDHEGVFREWHEVLTKESIGGDLIYVLPYSVID